MRKPLRPMVTGRLSPEALVDLYVELRPKLERAIARKVGSAILAADLAQEMFFQVRAIKAPLATRADAERYFFRTAANAALDYIKVESRRRQILDGSASVFDHPVTSPEAQVLAVDQLRTLEDALAELPAKCRDILFLSRIEGLGHLEIANRLGVSRSLVEKYAVMALLHCRQRIKRDDAQKVFPAPR